MKFLIIKSMIAIFLGLNLLNCMPAKDFVRPAEQTIEHAHPDPHEEHDILLEMEKDREEGYVLFSLTNKEEKAILATDVGTNNSRVLLISPNGKVIEHYATADVVPISIRAGETHTWRINVAPLLKHYGLEKEAKLQMIWKVDEVKSEPFLINQRN